MQVPPARLSEALTLLRTWVEKRKLVPAEGSYVARSVGREPLRFTESGDAEREGAYRTHWAAPELSEKRRARAVEKADEPPELVVVEPHNDDWRCHRCGGTGAFLMMEPEGPACLTCAGLGELELLRSGDAKLTRRARAKSEQSAVVVRWSKSRKRYERIGVLVEAGALAEAEKELGLGSPA